MSKDTRTAAPPPEDTAPVWRAEGDEDEQEDDGYDEDAYLIGAPNLWMVKDALRQFTTLADTIPTMEARMAEHRCLLRRTKNLLEKATPDARELTVTREYLETFVLARMKAKRELWDGTGKMDKQNRKIRMEWLRAERKVEGEKKWRTENEEHKKRNLEPVPLSAFLYVRDLSRRRYLELTHFIDSKVTRSLSKVCGPPLQVAETGVRSEDGRRVWMWNRMRRISVSVQVREKELAFDPSTCLDTRACHTITLYCIFAAKI